MIVGLLFTWTIWMALMVILAFNGRLIRDLYVIAIPVVISLIIVVLNFIYEPLAIWGTVAIYLYITTYITYSSLNQIMNKTNMQ